MAKYVSPKIEEKYVKLSQREHVLHRPDTYIGSVKRRKEAVWVVNNGRFELKEIEYVPGLYKIFDEILVNAADHKIRDPDGMTELKVTIDPVKNLISVYNDGKGIPVQMHKEYDMLVPTLIFGHLLTSSNYDDKEKKVVGGRNGFGAKLTNIFSTEFTVETCDGKRLYKQVWSKNMADVGEATIADPKAKQFTKITFSPDLAKFGMTELEADTVALLTKRVYDVAGCHPKMKVSLNGEKITMKNFSDYVMLYFPEGGEAPFLVSEQNERWEVVVTNSTNGFMQTSFVNSCWTLRGGNHVESVMKQITEKVLGTVKKGSHKTASITARNVRENIFIFIKALIENPSFDSQTKETLTTLASDFGSKCELGEKFLKKLTSKDSPIMNQVFDTLRTKEDKELAKTSGKKSGRLTGIPKLDDANKAGTAQSQKCTLILTEGDSAKALAVAGLGVIGRDYYGVFPLRGKILNVRDAAHKTIMDNPEINYLKQILGLKHGVVYTAANISTLRYGHLMAMTDQDHDGSHIKGLLINFLHFFWPSLLKVPGFLREFVTPVIKCMKNKESKCFYNIPEYEKWKEQSNNGRGWKIKYYKGLGTSTSAEAKEYFKDLREHEKDFKWENDVRDSGLIELAFSKKQAEQRKQWLRELADGVFVDHAKKSLTYDEFINKELILFSSADNVRSIPSVMDGFKPSQRKILYACFKRNLKSEIKVAQLSGYIAEHSAYHHGEQSLQGAIVTMAQTFVASNNVNLLVPAGMFGTRLQGGKDAASARYIFTNLCTSTRQIFNADDDALLNYLDDDGQSIEPSWYLPIIPMILVNGADGIGTGWSTNVPLFDPLDVIDVLLARLDGITPNGLRPWYRGFVGTIEDSPKPDTYIVKGKYERDDTELTITELPVGMWTQTYKDFLETMLPSNSKEGKEAKNAGFITDFKEYHTETTVKFVVTLSDSAAKILDSEGPAGLEKRFKLSTSLSTSNMVAFDPQGRIKRYETPEDIVDEYFPIRLNYYSKRKTQLLEKLGAEFTDLSNKVRFIKMIIAGELVVSNKPKKVLMEELKKLKFDPILKKKAKSTENAEDEDEEADSSTGYNYLLSMPIWSLTLEHARRLQEELVKLTAEIDRLTAMSAESMWRHDLEELHKTLSEARVKEEKEAGVATKRNRPQPPRPRPLKSETVDVGEYDGLVKDPPLDTSGGAEAKPKAKRTKKRTSDQALKPDAETSVKKPRKTKAKGSAEGETKKKKKRPNVDGSDSEEESGSESIMSVEVTEVKERAHRKTAARTSFAGLAGDEDVENDQMLDDAEDEYTATPMPGEKKAIAASRPRAAEALPKASPYKAAIPAMDKAVAAADTKPKPKPKVIEDEDTPQKPTQPASPVLDRPKARKTQAKHIDSEDDGSDYEQVTPVKKAAPARKAPQTQAPVAAPTVTLDIVNLDSPSPVKPKASAKPKAAPKPRKPRAPKEQTDETKKRKPAAKKKKALSDDEEDDDVMVVESPVKPKQRAPRKAVTKAKYLDDESDQDDDDDFIDDE